MAAFSRVICIFLFSSVAVKLASSDCHITVPSEQQNVPRFGTWLGLKWLEVPVTNTKLNIYGTITVECLYGFSAPNYKWLREASSIKIQCVDDRWFRVFLRDNENPTEYLYREWFWSRETFSCSGPNLQLYQSRQPFDWCESYTQSYYLKIHLLNGQKKTLAFFCYNVENTELHTFTYKSSIQGHNQMTFPNWNFENESGVEVENFQRILSSHSPIAQELSTEASNNMWLKMANYGYSPVVQTGPYAKFFIEFSTALDIIWWPSLLYGNWHRFSKALEKQASKVAYTITTGTSGIAELPYQNQSTGKLELEKFSFGSKNTTIPKYIWALGITDDRREDFLVISYNSPFFELANKEDVIFCKDICHQYEWLNDARPTFSYAFVGVTFCCALEEAVDILEGLPIGEGFINPQISFNYTPSPNEIDISQTANSIADNIIQT